MPPFSVFNLAKSNILNQDDLFTKSSESTREAFDKTYKSIINPKLYSLEALLKSGIFEIANGRVKYLIY